MISEEAFQLDFLEIVHERHSERVLERRPEILVRRMAEVADGQRAARIRCALALAYRRDGAAMERVVEAAIEGVVARQVHYPVRAGFPYRAVLYLPERGCYLAQLGEEEEARIGQRRTAIERADAHLREIARMRCAS